MSAVLGAIIGDIAGSKYEFHNIFTKDFELLDKDCYFTDDTVLTLAIAKACKNKLDYAKTLREVCKTNDYIHDYKCSFGARYIDFVLTGKANFSYGNGSAIRVVYLGQYLKSMSSVLKEAEASAIASHTHPDAIAGAKCIAGATYLAKKGSSKKEIFEKMKNVGSAHDMHQFDILLNAQINCDITQHLPNVKCPTYVIASRDDILFNIEYANYLIQNLNCKHHIYEGFGHAVYDEAPDFTQRLLDFFDRV